MTKQVRVAAIRGLADRDERGPAHRRCPAYHRHDTTLEAARFISTRISLGMTPSELMRQALRYVAEHGQLPFELAQSTKEEIQLAKIHHRIASPRRVKVSLKDL